jgi:osmoprotectant transport system substrate-binding protein
MKTVAAARAFMALGLIGTAFVFGTGGATAAQHSSKPTITVAARNFTEEQIAGNLYGQLLQAHGFNVKLNTGFDTEESIFSALRSGSVDVVPDYLGNGLVDLNKVYHPGKKAWKVWHSINNAFKKKHWHVTLLKFAYKFNDQNVFATTQANSKKFHLKTLSDLAKKAPKLSFEVMQECTTRTDCLKGFDKIYKPKKFKSFADPSSATTPSNPPFYGDLTSGKYDVVQGYGTTDAQISHFNLVPLTDNKKMFPPDQMTPFVRNKALNQHPEIRTWLNKLEPLLTNKNFSHMNAQVAFGGKLPANVAHKFLKSHHLL